jgi:hypothetical protein
MRVPIVEVELVTDSQSGVAELIRVTLRLDDTSYHKLSASMNPEFNEDIALNQYTGEASTFEGAFIALAKDIHRRAEFSYDQKMRNRVR